MVGSSPSMVRSCVLVGMLTSAVSCKSDYSFSVSVPDVAPIPTEQAPSLSSLKGRVCSPSGLSWVGAAEVRVRDTELVARTDAIGRYQIDGLEPGRVTLDITKGSFATSVVADVNEGLTEVDLGASCLGADVSIAVVVGLYDSIETLLANLGLPYTLVEVEDTIDWLRDPKALADYDMVFFNCGMRDDWVLHPEVVQHLRGYVSNGGSLYVSDRAYLVVEEAFPEAFGFLGTDRNPLDVQRGLRGDYRANVVDPQLRSVLGESVADIRFEFDNWTVADEAPGGEVLLTAAVDHAAPLPSDDPVVGVDSVLAARARVGSGTVVFTSFHNHTQAHGPEASLTGDMLRILEDVILDL